ncbi:hybrid sensor histidine kinase/response regulator [Desulfocicer vacuolatum]|nr:PAS domain S-box protein [Desulfocicer vacuolatum]
MKKSTGIILLSLSVVFCIFFFSYNQYQKKWIIREMAKHAEIVKEDVWETNYQGTRGYLELVAKRESYSKIELSHAKTTLLTIEGPRPKGLSSTLDRLGFFPEKTIITDIYYDGQRIGTLKGYHRNMSFYVHFIAFIVLLLISVIMQMVLEITKQKFAKIQLKKRDIKYNKMFSNIGDVIVIIGENGITQYRSDNITRHFGWKTKELEGGHIWDFIHPDDLKFSRETFERFLTHPNKPIRVELRYKCRDGRFKWIQFTGINLFHDPDIKGILGNFHDISEKKQTEKNIKLKNKIQSIQLQLIKKAPTLSTTALLQKFLDEAETLTHSSIGFYHFFNEEDKTISLQAWSTNTMNNMCKIKLPRSHYPIDKAGIWCECAKKRKTVIHNDYNALKHKKGYPENHVPVIREVVVPIFRDNKIVAILGMGNKPVDYTREDAETIEILAELAWETVARKQTEEKINTSEEKFRLAFLTSPDSINLSRLKDGVFLEINEGFSKTTGYTRKEAIGKSSLELNLWKNNKDRKRLAAILKKDGIVENFEAELLTKSGKAISGVISASILFIENEEFILSITRDFTKQRKLERHYLQAQKMESIGTLAGGIAHDFNNILFPILGHSEMLLHDLAGDDLTHKSITAIHASALRAKDLVGQILTFSRQQNDDIKLMKIQPILKEAVKMLRATIPATIEIKQNIAAHCGFIKADPTQIHQMIMNLATNAFHAMETKGGTLTIALTPVEIDEINLPPTLNTPGQYAFLSVKDTGDGISANVAERIFEPFYTTKSKGKGTGLGLSVVHGIVKKFGGTIELNTEPGAGAEFKVYLPLESMEDKASGIISSPAQIPGGSESILLIDDDESIISMETQMLERLGYRVVSRTSSLEALELFKHSHGDFDLIISDLDMPKMPGDALAREFLSVKSDARIILCTGFSNKLTPQTIKKMGIKGMLHKPIILKNLAEKIREVLV